MAGAISCISVVEAISWIPQAEAISWIYKWGKLYPPNSLLGRGGRISGVRLHSVALHLLSKQHPHLTATRWVHSQILGKKSHRYYPTLQLATVPLLTWYTLCMEISTFTRDVDVTPTLVMHQRSQPSQVGKGC